MGHIYSKKLSTLDIHEQLIPSGRKSGDIINESFVQFCISNNSADMLSILDSGVDLASPYKGVPLIFSAAIALLNDESFDRFKTNWDILTNTKHFPKYVPILKTIRIGLTNFTRDNVRLRDSCYPVIHINTLTKNLVNTEFANYKTVLMCELESADLKKVMIGVMSTIENTLKYATRGNENVLYAYIGTPTQKFEQVIKKNAKYAIDNINALNNIWGVTLASDAYVKQYAEDYTVDNIVMATIAD